MNARIIANNLFFCVFLCPVMLPWQPAGTNYREEGPHLGFYIYIHVSYVYTPHTGNPLFHMQTSWRKLILTVSASRMRKWKSPKRFKHLVSIWLMSVLSSTNTYAPHDGKTVAMQIWPKKPVFCNFCCARETLPIKFTYLLFAYKNLRIHRNKRMEANLSI